MCLPADLLGLDNIGVFDGSAPLSTGGHSSSAHNPGPLQSKGGEAMKTLATSAIVFVCVFGGQYLALGCALSCPGIISVLPLET